MVQHFYQNSDKPASAPFLLKKDAALAYRQDGSLLYTRIIQADGTPQITLWYAAGNPLQAGAAYQKAEKEVLRITKKRKYFAQVIATLFPEQH